MNHTASQSIKKLLLLSLILIAGHVMGQSSQGQVTQPVPVKPEVLSSKAPQQSKADKPAKAKASISTTTPGAVNERKPLGASGASTKAAPVTTPGKPAATVSSKPARPVTAAPISQLEQVNRDIADIEAKLKKDGISATTKSALENRLVDLKKEQKRLSVPEKK
jgi:hypothetical protein